ncbi:MAG TPA: hypothetical protein VEY71_08730, partial [Chitinophagales bacterium]|nr:hypothetical protein [Chitinophagales bacterium]
MFQVSTRLFFPCLLLSLFALSHLVSAQQNRTGFTAAATYNLAWIDTAVTKELNDFKKHKTIAFDGALFDLENYGALPLAAVRFHVTQSGDIDVQLSNARYEAVSPELAALVNTSKISHQPVLQASIATERFRHFANAVIMPLRVNEKGQLEKLVSFDLTHSVTPVSHQGLRDTYAENSVLANGKWYKMGIQQDGIYKIDKAYLQSLGISTSSINPQNIRVYGNGGGMLPELNSAAQHDDLVENSIYVSGEADGQFNDDDFVLFYGQGPHRWKFDSTGQRFAHQQNVYSDYAYYFITVDLGAGKRISSQPQ